MIVRVGFDIVEVSRIVNAMRQPRFCERILTAREREYCRTPVAVAGRWAAKEAIYKALPGKVTWQDIEVFNLPGGAPSVTLLKPDALPLGCAIHVSISHERGIAGAVAILERLSS